MCASPSNILSKLEELKKWQVQQERLLEQHHRRLERNTFTPAEQSFIQVGEDGGKGAKRDQFRETVAAEVLTLSPPKSFKQIAQERQVNNTVGDGRPKPKQPFLRRGSGLARFRMSPGEQFKSFNNVRTSSSAGSVKHVKDEARTSGNRNRKESFNERIAVELKDDLKDNQAMQPLEKPSSKVQLKASWQNLPNKLNNGQMLPHAPPWNHADSVETTLNASDRELMLFEALEHKASQNSFGSANSSIIRLLSSTPRKSNTKQAVCNLQERYNDPQIESVYTYKQTDEDVIQLQYTRYKEDDRTVRMDDYEQKIKDHYLELMQRVVRFKEFVQEEPVTVTETEDESSAKADDTLQKVQFDDDQQWPDLETTTSSSSVWAEEVEEEPIMRHEVATMTEENEDTRLLEARKLEELEQQVKKLQVETVKISKMKEQLEQQEREFAKYKKELVKDMEEEKVRLNFALEEEKKKLAKEKMVYDRYIKESQNKPTRKEREEISALKSEVAALKETLKLKESKTGLSQARLRNQIKSLEKENSLLKAEIEKLNRSNGKLVASQKLRTHSDTKMLHEINRNLSKLAHEKGLLQNNAEAEDEKPKKRENKIIESNKENNQNTSNKEDSVDFEAIEERYNKIFKSTETLPDKLSSTNPDETKRNEHRVERTLSDGSRQIEYTNGNLKTVSSDGNLVTFKYYNGDVKETNLLEGRVVYRYHDSKINHTTFADGSERTEFPDGQVEKRSKDGCEIKYPNGVVRKITEGLEEICYPDGTTRTISANGEQVLSLPNGQKEIHTKDHKRREYPDGTVKILYPDGSQETRFANGRVRLKDRNGVLLMDR